MFTRLCLCIMSIYFLRSSFQLEEYRNLSVRKISWSSSFCKVFTETYRKKTDDSFTNLEIKVRSFLGHSCTILSSFKKVIISIIHQLKSKKSVLLKIITILKELRIAQLCSKNERTLHIYETGETEFNYLLLCTMNVNNKF